METWSKARVVQQSLSILFIEEVIEPESSHKVTHYSVAAEEEPEPSPKPETPSNQADELVSAIKKLGKMKSNWGKLCEPEPSSSKDLKKLKAFIFQCQLYFWSSSNYNDDFKKVTFALSYL